MAFRIQLSSHKMIIEVANFEKIKMPYATGRDHPIIIFRGFPLPVFPLLATSPPRSRCSPLYARAPSPPPSCSSPPARPSQHNLATTRTAPSLRTMRTCHARVIQCRAAASPAKAMSAWRPASATTIVEAIRSAAPARTRHGIRRNARSTV